MEEPGYYYFTVQPVTGSAKFSFNIIGNVKHLHVRVGELLDCSLIYKLTVWNVIDVLAKSYQPFSLRSPFAILQLNHCCMCLYFSVLLCHGYRCLTAIIFAARVAMRFFAFPPFLLPRHFHRCCLFCRCSARQQLSRLFIQGWTFLLLSCRFCSGPVVAIFILLLKMLSL